MNLINKLFRTSLFIAITGIAFGFTAVDVKAAFIMPIVATLGVPGTVGSVVTQETDDAEELSEDVQAELDEAIAAGDDAAIEALADRNPTMSEAIAERVVDAAAAIDTSTPAGATRAAKLSKASTKVAGKVTTRSPARAAAIAAKAAAIAADPAVAAAEPDLAITIANDTVAIANTEAVKNNPTASGSIVTINGSAQVVANETGTTITGTTTVVGLADAIDVNIVPAVDVDAIIVSPS